LVRKKKERAFLPVKLSIKRHQSTQNIITVNKGKTTQEKLQEKR